MENVARLCITSLAEPSIAGWEKVSVPSSHEVFSLIQKVHPTYQPEGLESVKSESAGTADPTIRAYCVVTVPPVPGEPG